MGIFDSLLGIKPQSQIGTLSSLATMPLGQSSMMGASPVAPMPTTPTAAVDPVSSDSDSGPSTWQKIAGIVGDALLTGTGHQTVYGPTALAYAKMQMDPTDKAYKLAQIAALQQKQPKAGEFQQKVSDLRANGATDADIASLIQNTVNPVQSIPGTDENGNHIMTLLRPGGMVGGVPAAQASGTPIGSVVAGHRKVSAGPDNDQSTWQAVGGAAPAAPGPFPLRKPMTP